MISKEEMISAIYEKIADKKIIINKLLKLLKLKRNYQKNLKRKLKNLKMLLKRLHWSNKRKK